VRTAGADGVLSVRIGLRTFAAAAPDRPELIAWGWAVNGFFSVLGSMLSTLVAMSYGFRMLLLLALCAYVLAVVTLRGVKTST
jgi:NADH:ubiquinone oxidoreductase subunit H